MTVSYILHLARRGDRDGETRTFATQAEVEAEAADCDEDLVDFVLVVERDPVTGRVIATAPIDVLKAAREIVRENEAEEAAIRRQPKSWARSAVGWV